MFKVKFPKNARSFLSIKHHNTSSLCLHSSDNSDSSENANASLENAVPLIVLGVVILMIIIMGCILVYLLIRRKRIRDQIGNTPDAYVLLSDGVDENGRNMAPGGLANGNRSIDEPYFKRDQTKDSLYDNEDSEGLVKGQDTKNEEGAGSVTMNNGNE